MIQNVTVLQINVLSVFGYSFEELMCPQDMHIRSSIGGEWKWAWATCAHEPRYGDWSEWTSCSSSSVPGVCQQQRIRFCKGGNKGYHDGCPKDEDHEKVTLEVLSDLNITYEQD